jgi:serine protease
VGSGFDGGQYGEYWANDLWMQDGNIVNALVWYQTTKGYDSGGAEVRAFMTQGGGNAPGGSGARAVMAVLAVPRAGPAPATVDIVEFYHAGLDHYFISAIPKEITDLDTGVHPGWARTGQTFRAYGIGSTGRTGRRPVCRAYGNPANGLDSHFYSASPDECIATMVNFGGSWLLEASEVFQMDLPDPGTGACPPGGVPIYRIFNQRKDANHRYTTSVAIRDQMVARGGVAEGYGPNAVALCGLP